MLQSTTQKQLMSVSLSRAPVTPNFPYGSSREIDGNYIQKINIGPPLFTLLQPKMLMDDVRIGWCDEPLGHPT